jgi:hypothetical protein
MANSLIVAGGLCRLYINNKIFTVTQSVSITQSTGEYEIFGINSPYPQEIAGGGQISVKGSVKGVRVKQSGGLQGSNARPLFSDVAASSYISLRLEDRSTGETIWSLPKSKIFNINEGVTTKGIYQVSFEFVGQILFWPLDLS